MRLKLRSLFEGMGLGDCSLCLFSILMFAFSTNVKSQNTLSDPTLLGGHWVDSVYNSMTPERRIAQLIWPMIEQIHDRQKAAASLELITQYQPGGILYMKNTADAVVSFTNKAQRASQLPMLVSIDGEWGLAMRVDGVRPFPKAMTLGAITDATTLYRVGLQVADQFKEIGIHVNFAPVADVNINPANPIIGSRSFGENPLKVAGHAVSFMRGMQDGGIMAVAKHFPGHGDTDTDSHLALPRLPHSRARFDSVELVPFSALIKNGVYGVMTAHLDVPALEPTAGTPSSVSKQVVTDLLKVQMGFSGLVITDAMNMKGVKKAVQPGRIDAMALAAGNDVLESTENIPLAIAEIKKAITNNELTWGDIEQKCKKVLWMKYRLGVTTFTEINPDKVTDRINQTIDKSLMQQLSDESLTLISHNKIAMNGRDSIAVLLMPHQKVWRDSLGSMLNARFFSLAAGMPQAQVAILKKALAVYSRVLWITDNQANCRSVWADPALQAIRHELSGKNVLWVTYTGSPYHLEKLPGVGDLSNLLLTYEDSPTVKASVAGFLAGRIGSKGELPVSVRPHWKEGMGVKFRFDL